MGVALPESGVFLTVVAIGTSDGSRLAASLDEQTESTWELLIAEDGDASAALATARGEVVMFLDGRDALTPDAAIAFRTFGEPDVGVLYADEDLGDGRVSSAKPDFAPEWLRGQFYLDGPTAYRLELLRALGPIALTRPGLYDLALRATERAVATGQRVVRIPSVLSTAGRPFTELDDQELAAVTTVLTEHLARTGGGEVVDVRPWGLHSTRRLMQGEPLVSVVIPTRGTRAEVRGESRVLVVDAVRGLIERTDYDNLEFVLVIDAVAPDDVVDELRRLCGDRARFVTWDAPFSFSGKMNAGVLAASAELVLMLNDDIEVIDPGWLRAMVALAQRPRTGLVGALLYFEDETIQHAGHVYSETNVTHIGLGWPRGAAGPHGELLVEREVTGVTAACALVSRSAFLEVGGFSPLLPESFNDVDLCMKLNLFGYQAYVTPAAELYHFESKSRDPKLTEYETDTIWGRWEYAFGGERFWHNPLGGMDHGPILNVRSVRGW